MNRKKRIAIVGCGGMGGGHAIAIASGSGNAVWNATGFDGGEQITDKHTTDISDKLELAGIYDVSPARIHWAEEMGFHIYGSYEEQLADPTVDIILIATPNHLHKDMSIAALRAGKHVLCEKPVTPASVELREILAVAAQEGKVFYPRQNRRWDKDYLIAKKVFDEGLIGKVFSIESRIMGSRGIPGDWRAVKAYGGGMMLDWGVHLLDRLLEMVQEKVCSVYCSMSYVTGAECEDGFKMELIFESGLTASVEVGTCHFIRHPIWYVAGRSGTVVVDDWDNSGSIVLPVDWDDRDAKPIMAGEGLTKTMAPRSRGAIIEYPLPDVIYDRNTLYANLVDTIDGVSEQLVTGEQALRVLRLMEAAFLSAESNSIVHFE